MDVTTLRCGAGGEPAASTSSTESEALRAISDAVDANIGDFVREMVEAGCDAVACGTLDDSVGEIEALTAIITAAMAELTQHGKGPAQWVLREVATQAGLYDEIYGAWEAIRDLSAIVRTYSNAGRMGKFMSRNVRGAVRHAGLKLSGVATIAGRKLPLVAEFIEATEPREVA